MHVLSKIAQTAKKLKIKARASHFIDAKTLMNSPDTVERFESKMATCTYDINPKNRDVTLLNYAEFEFKSDTFIFYLNLSFGVARSIFNVILSNYLQILISTIVAIVLYGIYKSFWSHVSYSKELIDNGFDHIKPGPDRLVKIKRAQNARRLGEKVPPPYPNGWFAVMESMDLGATGVVPVDVLGQNLCVYRGEDGIARCVDAYCPHLGANMGVGGTVSGNCIECPFHKWKFGEDGVCVSVPGIERAPRGVTVKTWTTVERNGYIYIWHDAEGREPQWEMPEQPEIKSWGYRGRVQLLVNAHIQDVLENAADASHFDAVHSKSLLTNLGEKYPRLRNITGLHVWSNEWSRNDDHTASIKLIHDYKMLNMNLFHVETQMTQIGPGQMNILLYTPLGPILIVESLTPLESFVQKIVQRFYSPFYNAPMVASFIKFEGSMVERDAVLWNSKKFINEPTYVRTDKTIKAYRSWYSQFYSENSTSFRDAIQKRLDW